MSKPGAKAKKREASLLLVLRTSDGDSPALAWVHASHELTGGLLSWHPLFSVGDLVKDSGSQLGLCGRGKEAKEMNKPHQSYPAIKK